MNDRLKDQDVAFVVTKPLQVMISMMVCDQLGVSGRSHLMVVTSFSEAEAITRRIRKHDPRWCTVSSFPTRREALAACARMSYSRVFLDSDVGLHTGCLLRRLQGLSRDARICIYEEGVGTYRGDLYPLLWGSIVRALGGAVHFGGQGVTEEVWLFEPSVYAQRFPKHAHKVRGIKQGLQPWLISNELLLETIFVGAPIGNLLPDNGEQSQCSLYLSGWHWESEVADEVQARSGLSVLKLHPHIAEDAPEIFDLFDLQIPARVPAELLIVALARRFNDVAVLHHGSSVERYISLPQVTYIKVPRMRQAAAAFSGSSTVAGVRKRQARSASSSVMRLRSLCEMLHGACKRDALHHSGRR